MAYRPMVKIREPAMAKTKTGPKPDTDSNAEETSGGDLEEIYAQLADSVAALNSSKLGADESEDDDNTWVEEKETQAAAKKSDGQESVDDPVRMYLREIGKVYLLSGADEKRLARNMEEGNHVEHIEQAWVDEHGEPPNGPAVLFVLLDQLHEERATLSAGTKALNVKKSPLTGLIVDSTVRNAVDAVADEALAATVAAKIGCEQDFAQRTIVRISVITHILKPELIDPITATLGGEKHLRPPCWDRIGELAPHNEFILEHFQHLQEEGLHRARYVASRPHPGRQHRPHPRRRKVRLPQRLQVQHLRHVVD
jgi:hypothetical protein